MKLKLKTNPSNPSTDFSNLEFHSVDSNFKYETDSNKPTSNRKIIFAHKRALGDTIMFSAGIRDFKLLFPEIEINVDSNHPAVFDNSPYLNRQIKKNDPDVEYYQVGYPAIASCNNTYIHFTQMFLLDMLAITDLHLRLPISVGELCAAFSNGEVGDPCISRPDKNAASKEPFISLAKKYKNFGKLFARQRGDIHLSDSEKSTNIIKDLYGINHYWVIAPGGKRDCTAKIWDWRKFQDVIDHFEGRIKFVVIGKSDLLTEKLNGVIDLVDKFNDDIRGLFSLVYHATGCVSGPSALMHIAAAIPPKSGDARKPCVSIFGGREPIGWSWYTNHQILHTNGAWSCCANGGCWKARTYPLQKDPKHNMNLCRFPIESLGQTVQSCMESITAKDLIRAISKYYEGDLYFYPKSQESTATQILPPNPADSLPATFSPDNSKRINLLGNLNSSGGGEQSLCMIASLLQKAGWHVTLYPFSSIHVNYQNLGLNLSPYSFTEMPEFMEQNIPLLFYANDCTHKFAEKAQAIVDKSSTVIIGINYLNKPLPTCHWLAKSGKVKAFIFQNEEKKAEFEKEQIGFDMARKISLFGAIDLHKFLEVCPVERKKDESLIVLKHCTSDWRKYVTKESEGKGEKIHVWQKHLSKENDIKFYGRLLKDLSNVRFEFMEAHKELALFFSSEPKMVFHKWDSIDPKDFLKRGHVYLYRSSNAWRDQYPRVVAEALATGLPVISEPRDGTKDRIVHGCSGFYATHYDEFLLHLKTLLRKENLRHAMGMYAKDWARKNLDPIKWVEVINELLTMET